MDRRKFLKQVSLWSAGIIMTPPVFDLTPELLASSLIKPDVLVAKGENYFGMVTQVVQAMGGIQAFVKPGDKVVIKPNIGWDRNVEQGANTHPVIVSRLASLCLDAGASKVLVFDRTCNEERRCYHNSGIKSALKEIRDNRLRLEYVDDRKFVPVTIKNGKALKQWSFYKDALEADCYINVPVAKHHGLSGLSLGLKNVMGIIGGWRGRIHYQLGEKLADLNTVIKPGFTIVDATRVITRNGPQGGDMDDVKKLDTIIGCVDPVAADAYATTLFGLKPDQIKSTVEAYKRGLGQMDLDKCNIRNLKALQA
ncbi:DUF362 domain-containing protein [Desulfobacula toluolica]|uniref:Conserved uncharacterized protein n=1 Tax=Desulfobacula toluolica (strain DSM 7467 / Tol2) TaxID=651182 RepID=K0NGF6_DESTT|nr:DUF362 domain-containing protein [Desulfobacula toluolica]CCK78908.1 conserved uncharacterized protein [Desulfobacula toluolica Tol2]